MGKKFGWAPGKKGLWHDDWTLIVRLHAMIETGLNASLINELERPELESIVSKPDTSNQATGKVAFAKALGIIDEEAAEHLRA